ncbi:MAG: 4Fe-4S dicluster domain-containing protein [Thermoprotei archaeon]|jgi:ferredoxin like protein|uniref:Ferredoxin-like protein n=1 Tax=Fervidicoccus fontis TaxID=683846 RepID=A0A7J3SLM8_9CREN|nr:4Fe-4S dicluster domain-containing protein [Thermoprotei archaeon]
MGSEVKKIRSIDEIMKNNRWVVDEKPHIIVDYNKCSKCDSKVCVFLCPAGCYTLLSDGKLSFNYEGCLECGTCRLVCPNNAISWEYPEGGKGIQYRYG